MWLKENDAADSALEAGWDIPVVSTLQQALEATVEHSGSSERTSIDNETLTATANDTSVIIVTAGGDFNLTDDIIVKHGFSTNLWEASFWGMNTAVNIQNTSVSYITDINVTTHNGAGNIYAYGSETVVHVDGAWLHSSGAAAHGLMHLVTERLLRPVCVIILGEAAARPSLVIYTVRNPLMI